jgi:hypothetical protein
VVVYVVTDFGMAKCECGPVFSVSVPLCNNPRGTYNYCDLYRVSVSRVLITMTKVVMDIQ